MEFYKFSVISCFLTILQLESAFQTDISHDNHDVQKSRLFVSNGLPAVNSQSAFSPSITEKANWPNPSVRLGQVSAVALDSAGNVFVFHRGNRTWNSNTFTFNNVYSEGLDAISNPTLAIFKADTGALISQWGEHLFFLPHGITVDGQDNVWFTDVALHQVFKYSPIINRKEKTSQMLVLGIRFEPGNDDNHFCKPTSVAVFSNGYFFIADGYCNSRILEFSPDGTIVNKWGRSFSSIAPNQLPPEYSFNIPHGLALAEDKNLLYVADRENGRIQAFYASNGTFAFQLSSPQMGSRLFSVAYTPAHGGLLYIVNGPELNVNDMPIRGFVATAVNCKVIAEFHPALGDFHNPHSVAVSLDGSKVYVAELHPYRIWQFSSVLSGSIELPKSIISSPANSSSFVSGLLKNDFPLLNKPSNGTLMAVLVVSATLLFGATLLAAMLIYTRSRNRVCGEHCTHRWGVGSRGLGEGFSLGLLGQRSHSQHGFEKLKTAEESEEEEESQAQDLQPIV